jgi:3-dehydroquinate synthase
MTVVEEMTVDRVNLGERSYPILVGEGVSTRLGEVVEELLPDVTRCVVVTSPSVGKLYGDAVRETLERISPVMILVPEGEDAKTWSQAERLLGALVSQGFDRRSLVVALGGGSVGDLAGFVASIYLRGVRVAQVPTTLLGQVDSGIGGKTSVNHPTGKNLIGAFHQPSLVVCDPLLLGSLPSRELRSGLGEVVKYGVVADEELFKIVEAQGERLVEADPSVLTDVIKRCVVIKSRYVERDERDSKGVRAALNYGHTVGHALETLSNHSVRHGEAVAMGMVAASRIAVELGLLNELDLDRQVKVLEGLGIETALPPINILEMLAVMRRDKKAEVGRIRFVLPTGIGTPPLLRAVTDPAIIEALEA